MSIRSNNNNNNNNIMVKYAYSKSKVTTFRKTAIHVGSPTMRPERGARL